MRFTRFVIACCKADVRIDWHGHNDRGFALENALVALEAGRTARTGASSAVGERVGNTSLELMLFNLALDGRLGARSLAPLNRLCRLIARAMEMPLDASHPIAGEPPSELYEALSS